MRKKAGVKEIEKDIQAAEAEICEQAENCASCIMRDEEGRCLRESTAGPDSQEPETVEAVPQKEKQKKDDLQEEFRAALAEGMRKTLILQSAKTIREECRRQNGDGKGRGCADCPLSRPDGKCAVTWDIPSTWKLAGEGPWRAIL